MVDYCIIEVKWIPLGLNGCTKGCIYKGCIDIRVNHKWKYDVRN